MLARLLFAAVLAMPAAALAQTPPRTPAAAVPAGNVSRIVAVVNGEVISNVDVDARRRLLAMSAGLLNNPEAIQRLTPQVVRQLIDERLKLQEMQRRQVVVSDKEIAAAFAEIERRNGMQPGALRRQLAAAGVDVRTMIDQVRVQIGWSRVLREALGPQADVSAADIAEQAKLLAAQTGQTEYEVGEIFLPALTPAQGADAQSVADTIITQLRNGVPFGIVAAQFSQGATALQGGDLGWVQANQLDPEQLRVLNEMPVGAVSNPLRVPGGISIVSLRGKRVIGKDVALMAKIRQVVFPFAGRFDPASPTPDQRQALESARKLASQANGCDGLEAAAKAAGGRFTDPGDVRVDSLANTALRQLIATLPVGKPSQPVVAQDGVAVMMVCDRGERNVGIPDKAAIADQILNERVELASRRLMADLQRRATIDLRS